jgi:acetyl esterase/lipase
MNGPKSTRELWIRGVAQPEISVFRPARPDGTSVLALPGGGYEFLSVQNEGLDVAQRFNATRTTVFVLSYRLPREGWRNPHLAPLQDAQRAIRLIRRNAEMLDVVPDQVGVLGFSAGGHLAADLATSFNETTYRRVDEADRLSARPAFAGLIYPVIHIAGGSGRNLLGHNPAPAMVAGRSPLLKLGAATPPTFLVHAFDDGLVPIENSLDWIVAARAKQLPVDAHLFASGGHGFGLHLPEAAPGSKWPELFNLWMRKSAA